MLHARLDWLAGIKTVLAGMMIGTMTVVFVVSKAALVFCGELSPYLGQGMGFVILGAAVMGCVALLSERYRGVIVQPQDVTAVMIASGAGAPPQVIVLDLSRAVGMDPSAWDALDRRHGNARNVRSG